MLYKGMGSFRHGSCMDMMLKNVVEGDEIQEIMVQNEEYPYLYETHLHTSEASACAKNTAEEMVQAAKDYGYAGIFVTNHAWYGNTGIDRSLPWTEWVRGFCDAYDRAKAYGDRIGLDVFFGYESCYDGTEFLVYGVDEEWLLTHPQIKDASIEEQLALVHEAGGIVIHAHPFREEAYIPKIRLFPELVDGAETINATHSNHLSRSHNNPEFDRRAVAYAREYDLPMTAGSDVHSTQMLGGGVAFKTRLASAKDYCNRIRNREDYILTNGDVWFDGVEI